MKTVDQIVQEMQSLISQSNENAAQMKELELEAQEAGVEQGAWQSRIEYEATQEEYKEQMKALVKQLNTAAMKAIKPLKSF